MERNRFLIIISLLLVVLLIAGGLIGALLRLINEIRFSLEYFLPYWLVSPILFICFCLIIAFFIQYGLPYWKTLSLHKNQKSTKTNNLIPPKSKSQAANKSLENIDKLIEKLKGNIAKEVLQQEREKVAQELERGDLIVVLFGTGSSGKTSLIRALLNEIVGEVDAFMGSTIRSKGYRLRLKGLSRCIQLIDTPGILESGLEGKNREREARRQASIADLLIMVVDGDLRSSEFNILVNLGKLGKKLILVLNKCDLRGEKEERRLLEVLGRRCSGLINKDDIVATSSSPQTFPRPGKRPWQPPPEIDNLVNRLAQVLHADGEELLADNILLQCRKLGEKGRTLLDNQRKKEARITIDRFSWVSGGLVTANPLPGVDLLGTAAVNAQMVMEISKTYGVEITRKRAQELAISVGRTLTGLGVVKGGVSLITTPLSLNLPAFIVSRAIQGVAAAWLTRIAGATFITYFEQDQDWGDGGVEEVVQRHYELNRRESSLKQFLEDAIRQVVQPLQNKKFRQLPPQQRLQEEEEAIDHENLKW